MIIKKITIENFLCYYGIKEFEFSKGLNIILGENGEGKTKFFDAIEWLLNTSSTSNEITLISQKALSQATAGESFQVSVKLTCEHEDETVYITRQFRVSKINDENLETTKAILDGIKESRTGERDIVDGKQWLDIVFPPEIRRYSMFKGESSLNILKQDASLLNLINLFSDARSYDKYASKIEFLREEAEKEVSENTRINTKKKAEFENLEKQITLAQQKKSQLEEQLDRLEQNTNTTIDLVKEAEKFVVNATALETINKRLDILNDRKQKNDAKIEENYTTSLLDDFWILMHFESIHNDFSRKIQEAEIAKRQLQQEFDMSKGETKGRRTLQEKLMNNSSPLPIGVPNKAIMEEMLKDEICKVCNREAKEGTLPYQYMENNLKQFLTSLEPEINVEEDDVIFKHNYLRSLVNMSTNHDTSILKFRSVIPEIQEKFDFNKSREEDSVKFQLEIDKEKLERTKILGDSSLGEERLLDVIKNYNQWQSDIINANRTKVTLDYQYKEASENLASKIEQRDKIGEQSANNFLIKKRDLLKDIEKIFKETKERKFDEFLKKLEDKSNEILAKINVDAFLGKIIFIKKRSASNHTGINVELVQSDGTPFIAPNQSLETSMHIAVLFAISNLAGEKKLEEYPLIFDAPTSSFGESKTSTFLNLLHNNSNQKILLLKDFIIKDNDNKLSIKKEFDSVKRNKAFWVRLDRPFDNGKLSTINTLVSEI
jgi:DNA sulfur modification protein DndD